MNNLLTILLIASVIGTLVLTKVAWSKGKLCCAKDCCGDSKKSTSNNS